MPPRASRSRASRGPSREPEGAASSASNLQRPHLPELKGTPSSRRQYSYGAGVEPLPARPGRNLGRGQVMDLSSAVESALQRQQDEMQEERETARQRPRRTPSEEDELAGSSMPPPPVPGGVPNPTSLFSLLPQLNMSDDGRSYGTESNLYSDATLVVSPGQPALAPPPALEETAGLLRSIRERASGPATQSSRRSPNEDDQSEQNARPRRDSDAEIEMLLGINTPGVRRSTRNAPDIANPPTRDHRSNPLGDDNNPRRLDNSEFISRLSRNPRKNLVGDDGNLQRPRNAPEVLNPPARNSRNNLLGDDGNLQRSGNTSDTVDPSVRIRRNTLPGDDGNPQRLINGPEVVNPPARNPRNNLVGDDGNLQQPRKSQRSKSLFTVGDDRDVNSEDGPDGPTDASNRRTGTGRGGFRPKVSRPPEKDKAQSRSSHQQPAGRQFFSTDASEQDEAMQREIEQAEQLAARQEQPQAAREWWSQSWQWLQTQPPLSLFQPGPAAPEPSDDGSDDSRDHPLINDERFDFWPLLNPLTYIRAVLWLLENIFGSFFARLQTKLDNAVGAISRWNLMQRVKSSTHFLYPLILTIILIYASPLIASLGRSAYDAIPTMELDGSRGFGDISWSGLSNVAHSIGSYIPTVSWPSSSRWDDLTDMDDLDSADRSQLQSLLHKAEREIQRMRKAEKLHDASIKKLEAVVPRIVHMELRNGKPVIEQDFWHALRDLLVDDGTFLTLKKKGRAFEVASDKQWQSIMDRIAKDPAFNDKLSSSVREAESNVEKKWSSSWETWVKSNDNKIAKILGPKLEKVLSIKSDKEMLARVQELLKKADDGGGARPGGEVVTRAEFLRHLQREFATHKAEIRAQLSDHQPQLEQFIRETVEMATKDSPGSMTRAQVTELVDTLVRKSIADMNLAAMAKGQIHAHWDDELRNMVNYFGVGAGAMVDHQLSSATYKAKAPGRKEATQDALKKGLLDIWPQPQVSALTRWFDEGDCWCAALSRDNAVDRHGASLSVLLGHFIAPRTVVLEHILPGATTDPGARPRDVEIWAHVDDAAVREAVRAFSHTHFARYDNAYEGGAPRPAAYPERFVRIGRFVYDEGAERHAGVHVHQLSPEIASLGVETDQVIVRAVSNHGSLDHTCLYRVRLYGEKVEDVAKPAGSSV